jgi:hypothetical protein
VLLWKLPDQIDQKANDELLSQGCEAAQNYLNQNPKSLEIKNFCQQNYWHRPQPANPDIDSWLINDSLEAMQRGN